jgi:2'-hydroxyisoflavone reductase
MNILVLGGTRFVGRAIAGAALERGHEVTLFNRGSHPELFPRARRIIGDRTTADIEQVAARRWDCVVDVSAYRPAEVRSLLRALGTPAPHHVFISTVSVYDNPPLGSDERARLIEVDESVPSTDPRSYGGLKVLCEREMREAVGDRLTVLRPTVVIGPHDTTDRFPWWVRTVASGGTIAVTRPEQPVQLIDADDVAVFALRTIEHAIHGTFNTAGPRDPLTVESMVMTLGEALSVDVACVRDDRADGDLPLQLARDGSEDGFFRVSIEAALAEGLTLRPLGDSARAVLRSQEQRAESR